MSSPIRLPTLPGLDNLKPHWSSYFNPFTLPAHLTTLKDACVAGDMAACLEFGSCFEQGRYVERNMDLVSALYEDCCNRGEGACCARKGEYYAKISESTFGFSCWWKHSTARDLFEKGCEANDTRSCGALSELLATKKCVRDKVGAKKALAKAITLAKKNCYDLKRGHQCWILGTFLFAAARLEEQNESELLQQATTALSLGADIFDERCRSNGQDCYFLGELLREKYTRTATYTRNPPDAATAKAMAAVPPPPQDQKPNLPPPQPEDMARAKRAYEDGCLKMSDVESCTALAQMFTIGSVATNRDAELTMSYLARACRLSNLQCGLLGEFFAEYPHFRPPASEGIAESLFELACKAGNKAACHRAVRLRNDTDMFDAFTNRGGAAMKNPSK